MRALVAIPVYNEARHVRQVLTRTLEFAEHVLVIDDGSTDETPMLVAQHPVEVIRHAENRGYGRSMQDAFRWAAVDGFDWVITMDCDLQHEPASIPMFVERASRGDVDVVSGSRYLAPIEGSTDAPMDRRAINRALTCELNERLGLSITDAFCGFKAYRVDALRRMRLSEDGYAFPLQFWVQASALGLRIAEVPVRLIYNDPNRSFGGPLNDPTTRLAHYRGALEREMAVWLPERAGAEIDCAERERD